MKRYWVFVLIIILLVISIIFFLLKKEEKVKINRIDKQVKDKSELICENQVENKVSSPEEFEDLISNYYKSKDINKIVPAINFIIYNDSLFEKNVGIGVAFFAQVFKENPDKVEKWIVEDLCKLDGVGVKSWDIVITALWLADNKETMNVINILKENDNIEKDYVKYIDEYLVREPGDLKTMQITTALDLDMLWASFFATGDEVFIKQIISTLDYNKERDEVDLVSEAAIWSLKSNAEQHEKVLNILNEESVSNNNNQNIKNNLQDIINSLN